MSGCSREREGARPAAIRAGQRSEGHRHQCLRPRPGRAARGGRGRADRQALGARRHPDRRRDRQAANGLEQHYFAPPTLETVVVPTHPTRQGRAARRSRPTCRAGSADQSAAGRCRQEIFVSLYGEVQKEVIQQTLANDFGIDVGFRETTTICIERPVGSGAAFESMGEPPNPFMATIGVRIDPAPANSASNSGLEVEFGSIPLPFHKAVEDTARQTLRQGLYGWQVTDCTLTITHSGYSSAGKCGCGLPQLDAARCHGRTEAGRHRRMRADQSLPARHSSRHAGGYAAVAGAARRRAANIGDARFVVVAGGEYSGGAGASVAAAIAGADAVARPCSKAPSTTTGRCGARSRPGRAQTTIRSTARNTCCI